jgi:RNA polymerase sigma-70 factor (ECF subfamily)
LQRIRDNDQQAWHRLVSLYSPLVAHWCRQSGIQGADADDIVQEVWVAAAKSIDRFKKEQPSDTFRGWLFSVARYRMLDFFRRKRNAASASGGTTAYQLLANISESDNITLETMDDQSQLSALHFRALELVRNDFEDRTWQAFWKVVVDDRLPADVGDELGRSANAVRMAKSRVLRRLREEVGDLIEAPL